MVWFFSLFGLWLVGKRAMWLGALDATLKNQRRMRIEMHVGDASQMPQLSGGELEILTRELETLGFVLLGDIISSMDYQGDWPDAPALPAPIADPLSAPTPNAPRMVAQTQTDGVGRIFAHPGHGCYASLISVVSVNRFPPAMKRADTVNVAPFRTVILSLSGVEENSWTFSTHNRELQPFSLITRHPRKLSHRMVGARAAALLDSHLGERQSIATRAGCRWDTAPTLEKYQEFEARGIGFIRGVYERVTTPRVAWILLTAGLSRHERWMGELGAGRP